MVSFVTLYLTPSNISEEKVVLKRGLAAKQHFK